MIVKPCQYSRRTRLASSSINKCTQAVVSSSLVSKLLCQNLVIFIYMRDIHGSNYGWAYRDARAKLPGTQFIQLAGSKCHSDALQVPQQVPKQLLGTQFIHLAGANVRTHQALNMQLDEPTPPFNHSESCIYHLLFMSCSCAKKYIRPSLCASMYILQAVKSFSFYITVKVFAILLIALVCLK